MLMLKTSASLSRLHNGNLSDPYQHLIPNFNGPIISLDNLGKTAMTLLFKKINNNNNSITLFEHFEKWVIEATIALNLIYTDYFSGPIQSQQC